MTVILGTLAEATASGRALPLTVLPAPHAPDRLARVDQRRISLER